MKLMPSRRISVSTIVLLNALVAAPHLMADQIFARGDSNADGQLDLSDAVFSLTFLFAGGAHPQCILAADANDDDALDISDPVATLTFLFSGGSPPSPPTKELPGGDPTPGNLGCGQLAAPTSLSCTVNGPFIDISWENSDQYEYIEILRDGIMIMIIPGDLTYYADSPPAAGHFSYRLRGRNGCVCATTTDCVSPLLSEPEPPHGTTQNDQTEDESPLLELSSALRRAIKAALRGPTVRDLEVFDHDFHIRPVQISTKDGIVRISGHLTHELTLRDDDEVYYYIEIACGREIEIKRIDITIGYGKSWIGWAAAVGAAIASIVLEVPIDPALVGSLAEELEDIIDGSWEAVAQYLIGVIAVSIAGDRDLICVPKSQRRPAVAGRTGEQFLVVWQDDSDGNGYWQIRASFLDASGARLGRPFTVNTVPDGQQLDPAVAMDGLGNSIVVWEDDLDGNDYYQIHGRMLTREGAELKRQFTVNSVSSGQQRNPAVAMSPDGNFVVAWQDDQQNDKTYQIYCRGFNADGSERFPQRKVNAVNAGQQEKPSIAIGPTGDFIVVWEDDQGDDGFYQIKGRGFSANGEVRVGQFTVNPVADGQQRNPVVAMNSVGDFFVAWEDDTGNDGLFQIHARGFGSNGAEKVSRFAVNSIAAGQQKLPAIAMHDGGDFVIAWQDDADENGAYNIAARGFNASGREVLSQFVVNRELASQQLESSLAINGARSLVAVWRDEELLTIGTRGFSLP